MQPPLTAHQPNTERREPSPRCPGKPIIRNVGGKQCPHEPGAASRVAGGGILRGWGAGQVFELAADKEVH